MAMMTKLVFIRRVAVAAFSAAATAQAALPALGQTALKFSLDWKYEGTQAPFLLALDKGYFRVEGLDVCHGRAQARVVDQSPGTRHL
jgi:NitT/TauT family transport system substrate-binding protein